MKFLLLLLLLCFSTFSYAQSSIDIEREYAQMEYSFHMPFVKRNPFGNNELVALIKFPTNKPAVIQLTIQGRDGAKNITHSFVDKTLEHTIPVLGLYPDFDNTITLVAQYSDGSIEKTKLTIKTPKLKKNFDCYSEKNFF